VALVLGVLFLGEPLTAGIVIGFVLIVLGSVLATRRTAPAKPSAALSRSPDLL
jgi:drug/metabolite transporter (DMT)-like permease